MPAPSFKAAGALFASAAGGTVNFPTSGNAPVADDVAFLLVQSENQVISLTTANGFVELSTQASMAAGTAATDPGNRMAVYWKRCVGGDAAPVLADSGDHQVAVIVLFSGVRNTGNPWSAVAVGNDSAANDTTGTVPGLTTTLNDSLVALFVSTSVNATGTANFSAWTNADLTSLTEHFDSSNTAGLGGGLGVASGLRAVAGTVGTTTVTYAATSFKGAMALALPGPGPRTGTIDVLSPRSTIASDGKLAFKGTATITAGNAEIAASGTNTDPSGPEPVTGTSAIVAPNSEIAATAKLAFKGTVAVVSPSGDIVATGKIAFKGTSAIVAPNADVAATGKQTFKGTSGVASPNSEVSAIGSIGGAPPPGITGTSSVVSPGSDLAVTGKLAFIGTASITVNGAEITAPAKLRFVGSAAIEAANAVLAATGTHTPSLGVEGDAIVSDEAAFGAVAISLSVHTATVVDEAHYQAIVSDEG